MIITDAFPSNYLKANDLQGREPIVAIADCQMQDFGGESKPVLTFKGQQKGLVLNRTNAAVLSAAYGDDTEAWKGKRIQLYSEKVFFQGQMRDGLRLRVPEGDAQPVESPPAGAPFDDDISF